MKNLLILFCISFSWTLNAQEEGEMEFKKISIKDSIELGKTFQKLLNAAGDRNEKEFLNLTLGKIDCDICNNDSHEMYNYVSSKYLYNNEFKAFEKSAVYRAIKKRGYRISCSVIKNYKPKNIPKNYPKNLTLYEVWVQTFVPNEWVEGHEGQSNAFQFVKINDEYKLYGLSSVP